MSIHCTAVNASYFELLVALSLVAERILKQLSSVLPHSVMADPVPTTYAVPICHRLTINTPGLSSWALRFSIFGSPLNKNTRTMLESLGWTVMMLVSYSGPADFSSAAASVTVRFL